MIRSLLFAFSLCVAAIGLVGCEEDQIDVEAEGVDIEAEKGDVSLERTEGGSTLEFEGQVPLDE
jgi:hypothetical protein